MYTKQKNKPNVTNLRCNESYEGETIENKVRRITESNEPISDGAPLIYQERKDGVDPACDIRTDRFEIAVEATTAIQKTKQAKREMRIGEKTYDTMTPEQQQKFHEKFPNNKFAKTKQAEGK